MRRLHESIDTFKFLTKSSFQLFVIKIEIKTQAKTLKKTQVTSKSFSPN
jgi:hypothetical protein